MMTYFFSCTQYQGIFQPDSRAFESCFCSDLCVLKYTAACVFKQEGMLRLYCKPIRSNTRHWLVVLCMV